MLLLLLEGFFLKNHNIYRVISLKTHFILVYFRDLTSLHTTFIPPLPFTLPQAGHPDLSPALAGRAGCCSILQRCLRDPIAGPSVTAALDHFLPCSIIDSLRASTDPKAVLETFDGEAETPARVWNAAMRKVLRKFVAGQLESYRASGEPDGHPWVLTHEIQVCVGGRKGLVH